MIVNKEILLYFEFIFSVNFNIIFSVSSLDFQYGTDEVCVCVCVCVEVYPGGEH